MSLHRRALILTALLPLACATTKATSTEGEPSTPSGEAAQGPSTATAPLASKSGSSVTGTAHFTRQEDGKIKLEVHIEGATPGVHAAHLHDVGDCSAEDGSSAGGHWNPTSHQHGKWGHDDHFHLGDIGNIEVGEDGKGHVTLTTDRWELGTGGMVDVVGQSVIVHTSADDFVTQPTGNAGGREACGVVALDG